MGRPKGLQLALAIVLLLIVPGSLFTAVRAAAAPEESRWLPVPIPAEGAGGNWQLASGSDVKLLTAASDGTLYAYASFSGIAGTLFRSSDNGSRWTPVASVTDVIVAIAIAPDDASSIYYATNSTVHRSTDGGKSFAALPSMPGGAGGGNIRITSLSVSPMAGSRLIAAGTSDSDSSQYGGVYVMSESDLFRGWSDTGIGGYDVVAIAFSPAFATDRQLIAVATNERDTLVTIRSGNSAWGQTSGNAAISAIVAGSATIAIPRDYDALAGRSTWFLGLDSGNGTGDVYRVEGRIAPQAAITSDLNVASVDGLSSFDITGLVVSGNASAYRLMAGAAAGTQVYFSLDGGKTWSSSAKPPTGQRHTFLLMFPDFIGSQRAYAVTSGTDSAFSYTDDGGSTWNQLSLIDTQMSNITGLAVSPMYSQDSTLFMLTWGGSDSLWRSRNGGVHWERVFAGTLVGATSITILEVSPLYGSDSRVLFLAGSIGARWAVWKTGDDGQSFTQQTASFSIIALAPVDNHSLFVLSFNGTSGLVYSTANSGFFYSAPAVAGSQLPKAIALSPDFEKDGTILVSNTNGWVYSSTDGGASFQPLPANAAAPPLSGSIAIAFDPGFSRNRLIYAASGTQTTTASKERIFRFAVGRSDSWESIDATLPTGSKINYLLLTANGVLYAANSMNDGGMERSLDPASPFTPAFETVTRGVTDNATLTGLWASGNRLWSIDKRNVRLLTYLDSTVLPVTLGLPADGSPGIGTDGVLLEWDGLRGATGYQWQVADEPAFGSVASNLTGYADKTTVRLPALQAGTTYYWRVRATEPYLSPWSEKRSFTTVLGAAAFGPGLLTPGPGASAVSRAPVFQWGLSAGAERYELLVSTNASFDSPVIAKTGDHALPANAWRSDVDLEYGTTYFWKVRAISAASHGAWSAVSAFTTEAAPAGETLQAPPPASSPPPSTSSQPPSLSQSAGTLPTSPSPPASPPGQPGLPAWAVYSGIALLAMAALLLAALVVLQVIRMRRP